MKIEEFIECNIDSVSVVSAPNGQGKVLIRIIDHSQQRWELTANSVNYFVLDRMCLQNLIEAIHLYDALNIDSFLEEVRQKIFYLLQGRLPDMQDGALLNDVIGKILDDIKASRTVLLEIQPLYGAHVLLLASDVSVSQIL